MLRISSFLGLCVLLVMTCASAQETKKDPPKKAPPMVEELLKLTPDEFIKRFDKNGDGKLTKDELPEFLGKAFDASDKNGDGKLDREEVAAACRYAGANAISSPPADSRRNSAADAQGD